MAADLRLPDAPDDDAAHETLFHALAERRFPEGLDGDFAIAVWDTARRELILARDRLGIRPLFLVRSPGGGIAFASFPEALIEGGFVTGRYAPQALVDVVAQNFPIGPETWIEGMERLLPGHVLTFSEREPRSRRYWSFPVARQQYPRHDHASAAGQLRAALERAISRALPARGPVCTHLSGGLDSGAVASLAARLCACSSADVTGYCITMPEAHRHLGEIDEAAMARAVAGPAGVTLVTYPFELVVDNLLRPLGGTFPVPATEACGYLQILADAARRHADRILCGFGGDEVVSYTGEGALLADFLALRWGMLGRTARELSEPAWRALARQAAGSLLPPEIGRRLKRALSRAPPPNYPALRAIRPAFRPAPDRRWPVAPADRQWLRLQNTPLHHRLEFNAWHAAQYGLRYVFPLLDWRLIEFGAGLPARLQLHGGMRRALFRSAVADLLPDHILKRRAKLNATPTVFYEMAEHRAALIAEARRVAASPAAAAVIDLDEVERQLANLPAPETVAAEIAAAVAVGRHYYDPRIFLLKPMLLARALAQNEADCATRAGASPRAA